MVADITHEIAKAYDVESAGGVAFRGSFLIDKKGVVQHQVVNNLPLGRNIDEMLRMVDALQFTEEHGEVCPAGWSQRQGWHGRLAGRRGEVPGSARQRTVSSSVRINKKAPAGAFVVCMGAGKSGNFEGISHCDSSLKGFYKPNWKAS